MNDPLQELIRLLGRLPGIGERTAQRLAFFLLRAPSDYVGGLGHAISEIRSRVRACTACGNWTEAEICRICSDPKRDGAILCVVATVQDLWAVERTNRFGGRYQVLGNLLAPLDGVGPDQLPMARLSEKVSAGVEEVVIATPATVEGEATALYISRTLKSLPGGQNLRVTRIASGVQYGGDLEYADQVTLTRALEGRRDLA